jgi:FKBP-type peptidyl-prolyl cis-trans isomerase FkpA
MRGGETVRKLQTRILSVITIILVGITMFSMANATTPEENKAAGEAFLAENAKKPNITMTASGLQYEILKKGEGATPSATDNVTVHYKGTTIDGNEFDSSYSRGEPATFPLNRVIPGWTEGVQLMQEGAKYRFYIPSELAYGAHGAGRLIGPNSTLIFDVELIKIQ